MIGVNHFRGNFLSCGINLHGGLIRNVSKTPRCVGMERGLEVATEGVSHMTQ